MGELHVPVQRSSSSASANDAKLVFQVKRVFIHMLPRLLLMKRPPYAANVNKVSNLLFLRTHRFCIEWLTFRTSACTQVSAVAKANSPYVHQAHHHSSQPYFPPNSCDATDEKMPQTTSNSIINAHRYKQVVRTCTGTGNERSRVNSVKLTSTYHAFQPELRDFAAQTGSGSPTDSQPPLLPSPTSPYRRTSYELAAHPFDALPPPTILSSSPNCRVHGLRSFPPPPLPLEEHLIIRERIATNGAHHQYAPDDENESVANDPDALPDPPPPTHNIRRIHFCPEFLKAMENVQFIADHTKEKNLDVDVSTGRSLRRITVLTTCARCAGGLEVRGDGSGPAVPVDLHRRRPGRHMRHHFARANALRRQATDRREAERSGTRHSERSSTRLMMIMLLIR